jgi:hypothetical protein
MRDENGRLFEERTQRTIIAVAIIPAPRKPTVNWRSLRLLSLLLMLPVRWLHRPCCCCCCCCCWSPSRLLFVSTYFYSKLFTAINRTMVRVVSYPILSSCVVSYPILSYRTVSYLAA